MLPPAVTLAALALLSCTGSATFTGTGDPGAPGDPGTPGVPAEPDPAKVVPVARFSCSSAYSTLEAPLRRLSRVQYQNTVRALVQRFAPSSGAAILTSVQPILGNVFQDAHVGGPNPKRGGFTRLDQSLQQGHIDVSYQLATAIGAAFTQSTARVTEVFGACATDGSTTNDKACLDTFVREFGARAKRHPLGTDDVAFYERPIGTGSPVDRAALADVVALILQSPGVFFFEEHGQDGPFPGRVPLDAYELASRLSYNFWNAPPDEELWQAAASGALLTEAGYTAQLQRVVSDAKAAAALSEFMAQWLRLDTLPSMSSLNADAQFKAFLGSTPAPTASTTADMVNDVLSSALAVTREGGGVSELLTGQASYAKEPLLAGIYGTSQWDGTSAPSPVTAPARAGLLTRAAMLATGVHVTRPIMKGVFIRTALLCDPVPPPPPGACMTPPPPLPAVSTTREKAEALTEKAGTSCSGCHMQLINPLGHMTENFDALGRERSEEPVFDSAGTLLGAKAIHTDTTLLLDGSTFAIKGAADATRLIDASRKVHSCFSEQYLSFVLARTLDAQQDGCGLSTLESAAMANAPLSDLQRRAASLAEFKTRSFQ